MKRRTRMTISLIATLAFAAVIGNVLLFNALPKPDRLKQPIEVDYGVTAPQFERSMGLLLKQPLVEGNSIETFRNADEIYGAMLTAIDEAEHSITFETYEFWGPESAGRFAEALAAASDRGVKVHALLDYVGSVRASTDKFDLMTEAGVELIRWRKPSWYQLSRFNHRTHRKLMVVDGHTGFTGGSNIADDWIADEDGPGYRDNHFRLQGPIVGNMQAAFMETWLDASGNLLLGDAYYPELETSDELTMQVVNSAPREGRHRMRMMLMYAIAAAREQITMSTAYFYPDQGFLDALTHAAERGVDVRILVPGESIDKGFVRHASLNRWGPMLEAGVQIFEYQPSMYHSKLISIDDAWSSIGSTNLDNRSFRINDEANINIYNSDAARQIRELVEEDLPDSKRYDLARWEDRSWFKRLAGWISMTLGAHF